MYELEIPPHLCLRDSEVEALRGTLPNVSDYEDLIEEDTIVSVRSEGVIAVLVRNALSSSTVRTSKDALRIVHGDLSNRGSIVYRDSMLNRERVDRTLGFTKAVTPAMLKLLRDQNARVGLPPPQSDFLGYYDRTPRIPFCRETAWTIARPDIFAVSEQLVREIEYVHKAEYHESWRRQREFMRAVSADFKYHNSIFSTMTVNLNVRCAYHSDDGDFRGGMGNLVVLELGRDDSGMLVMPRERTAFLVRPGDVLLMDVHRMHGNAALTVGGTRLTVVNYARQHINRCG